ncbi:hypothetical protein [Bacillus alkalicellulosilyticus]|uniref:hypothetical protein n=1 Tax=Alkalihalobacterium alkalicellulosilyticum TaxID=1912214 RepID=UPI0009960016|nr:hypothetical protein [Bacillus alkalicellulosilyticus]
MTNHQIQNADDATIQLKQKLIHYRSELTKVNRLLTDYQKHIKYLQSQKTSIEVIKEVEVPREVVKEIITEIEVEKTRVEVQAYFSYSTILAENMDKGREITILGNFIIKNIGNQPLSSPFVCIKITPSEQAKLSGKIVFKGSEDSKAGSLFASNVVEWEYVHENWRERIRENGEHWLRPITVQTIQPGEIVSFSQFDIMFTPSKDKKPLLVEGFAYFNEIQEGMAACNKIIINY